MRFLKSFTSTLILIVTMACGGSKNETTNVTPSNPGAKSYGVFRSLAPKSVPTVKGYNMNLSASATTEMTARVNHRAILMMNGKVLLVGGDQIGEPSMDIYDPATETFTKSSAKPIYSRINKVGGFYDYDAFGICNLPDGKVLILGGNDEIHNAYKYNYEIYDPATDTITDYESPNFYFTGTDEIYYIGNNKVVIAVRGGTFQLLDLTTSDWSWITFNAPQSGQMKCASTIQDTNGDIWVFGGFGPMDYHNVPVSQKTVFKFNVSTMQWENKHSMITERTDATVVLLPNGKVGIYGGQKIEQTNPDDVSQNASTKTTKLTSAEIYDMSTDTISQSVDLVGTRMLASGINLQTGYTLIAGGVDSTGAIMNSELVHKHDTSFSGSTGTMIHSRVGHAMTNLTNGKVLISGGHDNVDTAVQKSAEIFDPQAKLYIKYTTEQIVIGDTLQLSAIDDVDAPVSVVWSVANSAYGTIDSNGLLTSLAPGIIEVTATSNDLTAIVRIKVIPK